MTVVRSDLSSVLQPRPRIPKPLPPPRDPKAKGKGKGNHKDTFNYKGGGKGKTKGSTFDKRNNWCTWGFHNNQRVTLCMKFNVGECKRGSECHSASAMDALVCRITQPRITKDPPDSGQIPPVSPVETLVSQFNLIHYTLTKFSRLVKTNTWNLSPLQPLVVILVTLICLLPIKSHHLCSYASTFLS